MAGMTDIEQVLDCYVRLTGREAKLSVYEFSLFDYIRSGFTVEDMTTVIQFIIKENKRNSFQYSLKLGHLLNDQMRFSDLLQEAKARLRNQKQPLSPKEKVLQQLRPTVSKTETGTIAVSVKDVLKKIAQGAP